VFNFVSLLQKNHGYWDERARDVTPAGLCGLAAQVSYPVGENAMDDMCLFMCAGN
jgi:hypothetical protein